MSPHLSHRQPYKKRKRRPPWAMRKRRRIKLQESFRLKELPPEKMLGHLRCIPLYRELVEFDKNGRMSIREDVPFIEGASRAVSSEQALKFVREHADALADFIFYGLSKKGHGIPFKLPVPTGGKRKAGYRKDKRLALSDPQKWFDETIKFLKKQVSAKEFMELVFVNYFATVNKMLDREADLILSNFRENAISYLDHRKFPIRDANGKVTWRANDTIDMLIDSQKYEILFASLSLPKFEKYYIDFLKRFRGIRQRRREQTRAAVLEQIERSSLSFQGREIRLVKGSPEHRRRIKEIIDQVYSKTVKIPIGQEKTLNAAVNKTARELVRKELKKIAEELREKEGKRKAGEERTGGIETREERIRRHAEEASQPGMVSGGKKRAAKEERAGKPAVAAKMTPFQRFLGDLEGLARKENAEKVYDFAIRNLKSGQLTEGVVKRLKSRIVRYAVNGALANGFEAKFRDRDAPAVLLNLLGFLRERTWTQEAYERRSAQMHKKWHYPVELIEEISHFLLVSEIIKPHHAGTEISIDRG